MRKSFYQDILEKNQFDRKPIWQYNISESIFSELKEYLSNSKSLDFIDSRDCAIYYAYWWKNEYKEGIPSKDVIFNSFTTSINQFDANKFYEHAKKGGYLLKFKWIKRENTLYFKTLLMQGGLPIKNLESYHSNYKRFLEKIIELKPNQISDFSNDISIISCLPISTRNEAIYETCLEISKAIWEDTPEGKKILDILENTIATKGLVATLQRVKAIAAQKDTTGKEFFIKALWELQKKDSSDDANIILNLILPQKIEQSKLVELVNNSNVKNEYHFFYNDTLIANYRKNLNGDYKIHFVKREKIEWNHENVKYADVFFTDSDGNKFPVNNIIRLMPSIDIPTLWRQVEENKWVLLNSRNCKDDSAFILCNTNFKIDGYEGVNKISINKCKYSFFEINDELILDHNDETYIFNVKTESFNWEITEEKTNWIEKSNYLIVKKLPNIKFFDSEQKLISNNLISRQWRLKGSLQWNDFHNNSLPKGIIELKFILNSIVEYDKVFNIGNAKLTFPQNTELSKVLIKTSELDGFKLNLNKLEECECQDNSEIITLRFNNLNNLPSRLKASISKDNSKLLFDFITPLNGIEIIDNEDARIGENFTFIFKNLKGYRILTPKNSSEEYFIRIYNKNHAEIKIINKLFSSLVPLRNFESKINELFFLADVMVESNAVIFEIGTINRLNNTFKKVKSYNIKLYNYLVKKEFIDNELRSLSVNGENSEVELFAIPLDCQLKRIEVISLHKQGERFLFPTDTTFEKFIVYNSENSKCQILPVFISNNPNNIETDSIDKKERISNHAIKLLEDKADDDSWQKLWLYTSLCIENNIPFSAFDIIRSCSVSSDLVSRFYVFLLCYLEENILNEVFESIENQLGYKFHWISYQSWQNAIGWIIETYGDDIFVTVSGKALKYIHIYYLDETQLPSLSNPAIQIELSKMREFLGPRIINELPTHAPNIEMNFINIMPVNNENEKIRILTNTPLAVALIKKGLYEKLWNSSLDKVRRNMMYCQNLDDNWYSYAVNYSFKKI